MAGQASPVSRNACGPDDPEQQIWERVQGLTGAQRRSRASAIVAREREEVTGDNERGWGGLHIFARSWNRGLYSFARGRED